jgi:hypothetical protein
MFFESPFNECREKFVRDGLNLVEAGHPRDILAMGATYLDQLQNAFIDERTEIQKGVYCICYGHRYLTSLQLGSPSGIEIGTGTGTRTIHYVGKMLRQRLL